MTKKFLGVVIGLFTIMTGWLTLLNIDWLSQIQTIVRDTGIWGNVMFVGIYAIATLLILPVTAFNIAGGIIYGGIAGIVLTSLGALISALLGFVLARFLGDKFTVIGKSAPTIGENLIRGGMGYAFAARLLPLIPYGVVSIAAGLSPIKRRDYLLGTLLGTPLGIAPFVLLGSTGVQVINSHDLLPLLASSAGIAILIMLGTWYSASQNKIASEIEPSNYADPPQ